MDINMVKSDLKVALLLKYKLQFENVMCIYGTYTKTM